MRRSPHRRFLASHVAALALLALSQQAQAIDRTYSSCPDPCLSGQPACPPAPIADFSSAELSIVVPNDSQGNFITDVNVTLWLTHTYQGDLNVQLISPSGTPITLVDRPGGGTFSADNLGRLTFVVPDGCTGLFNMSFDDDSGAVFNEFPYDAPNVPNPGYLDGVNPANPASGGSYFPVQPLAGLNGENKTGTWRLRVTDGASGDAGLLRFFRLNIRSAPLSQPTAFISSPTDFACGCNPLQVSGTAADSVAGLSSWLLEWSASANGPWGTIATGTTPVINAQLANWLSSSAGEGLRFLRLTATNALGLSSSFTTVAYFDQSFEVVDIESPISVSYASEEVCVYGTVSDYCFSSYQVVYAPPPFNSFVPINGGSGTFPSVVINDEVALWNVSSLPDGPYRLRVRGNTSCNAFRQIQREVVVDNTPPVALIADPANCMSVGGVVAVRGTASDANMSGWVLQVTGGPYNGWTTIGSGSTNVFNNTLATWNTSSLPDCAYTLRLVVTDRATIGCRRDAQSAEYLTSFDLSQTAPCDDIDFNNDGSFFDPCDIDAFLLVFSEGPCTLCGL
jgi:subtilisin-like proprotein convertase family protein